MFKILEMESLNEKMKVRIVEMLKFEFSNFNMLRFVVFGANQGLMCCHADGGEKVSILHVKDIYLVEKHFWGDRGS